MDITTAREAIISFEQAKVGDEVAIRHLLTEEDVESFSHLTKDYNPLHMDEKFARNTMFRKPVVHGMLSASFISTLIGMVLPGPGALWTSQTLKFLNPAFVGDQLTIKARVKQKSTGTRTLVLDIVVTNTKGQSIIEGESTVRSLEVNQMVQPSTDKRKVLIAGGSRGIGASVARLLAETGFDVIVNYRSSQDEADMLVADIKHKGGQAWAAPADISRPDQVAAMLEDLQREVGQIDSLVFCAAAPSRFESFESLEWESIQQQISVQLQGAFNCVKAILPSMVERKTGSIVFIGSIAADGVPPGLQTDYVIAKAALSALAKSLAVEYGPQGIRVNVVAPGMTQTERLMNFSEKAKMLTKMQTPLRRLAEPEDIAHAVAFLLGPGGRHITGETLRICGGAVME